MNNFKIILLTLLIGQAALAVTFKLDFKIPKDIAVKLSLFEVDRIKFDKVVGSHGDLVDDAQLEGAQLIKNFSFDLKRGETKVLALVAENLTNKELKFFVSPHESNAAEYSLDFKFNCLCYSHIYKINPKGKWYRIMNLTVLEPDSKAKTITLTHKLVKWNKK